MAEATINPAYEPLIAAAAEKHGLSPVVVRAMAIHESAGGITYATRYEPEFYRRYLAGKPMNFVPHGCSVETERIGRATSWGLMQVMGETARCNGFRGWFAELCDPATGLEWGCLYLHRLMNKYAPPDWPTLMRAYNGGPGNRDNVANPYPDLILAHIPGGIWPPMEAGHAC